MGKGNKALPNYGKGKDVFKIDFTFIKSRLKNQLGIHLGCSVKMFALEFLILENFPYDQAFDHYCRELTKIVWDLLSNINTCTWIVLDIVQFWI